MKFNSDRRKPAIRGLNLKVPSGMSLVLALLATVTFVGAWGQNGHRIVGRIAQNHLSPAAARAVGQILGGDTLAQVSTWADEIRSLDRWGCAAPFHYVTVPAGASYPDATRSDWDEGDAIRAIVFLAQRLTSDRSTTLEKRDALRFLVHVVGDLHQPLHIGLGCDRGGNDLGVLWFGQEKRLHAVWDEALIESENLSYTEYTEFLDRPGRHSPLAEWTDGPRAWILEAQALHQEVYRCNTARDRCPCFCGDCADGLSYFGGCSERPNCQLQIGGPVRLGYAYKARVKQVLESRLIVAGLRLATLLNSVLAAEANLPPAYRELRSTLEQHAGWDNALKSCFGGSNQPASGKAEAPSG